MSVLPTVQVIPVPERGEQPVFYYDLGDPVCYLVAEQVSSALPVVPEWEPVLAAGLTPPPADVEVQRIAGRVAELGLTVEVQRIADRVAELGLQPLRGPQNWPTDTREAMLAATFAKRIGRAVAFSLAAFRQAFAAGRDLADRDTIVIAGAACEIHPSALLRGMATRSVGEALAQATSRARQAGVVRVPAIEVSGRVFAGEDAIAGAIGALT